jgi:hypothetical protein
VHTGDGEIHVGELAGVGADFFDLNVGGAGQIGYASTISLTAVIAVQVPG